MNVKKLLYITFSVASLIAVGIGLGLQSIVDLFWTGVCLTLIGLYIGAHLAFGPLDWYIPIWLYRKLRRCK